MTSGADSEQPNHVQVVVRVRPVLPRELPAKTCVTLPSDGRSLQTRVPERQTERPHPHARSCSKHSGRAKLFTFDAVLDGSTTQEEFYDVCGLQDLAHAALEGYPVTVFAFGQTGAGKTHTVFGPQFGNRGGYRRSGIMAEDGLLPRAIWDAFKDIEDKQRDRDVQVAASCCEIYNETVKDLLAPREEKDHALPVCCDKRMGFYVKGLRRIGCSSPAAALRCIHKAIKHRQARAHLLNDRSSRSHCIVTLHFETRSKSFATSEEKRCGKLCIVDLAGSERLKNTGTTEPTTVKEAGAINKSLFALGRVLGGLRRSQGRAGSSNRIPFRDSKLTQLLWDGLKGNGWALMLVCCTPLKQHAEETINTLAYANTAIRITSNPVVTLHPQDQLILDLRDTISRLRNENRKLTDALKRMNDNEQTPSKSTARGRRRQLAERRPATSMANETPKQELIRQPSAPSALERNLKEQNQRWSASEGAFSTPWRSSQRVNTACSSPTRRPEARNESDTSQGGLGKERKLDATNITRPSSKAASWNMDDFPEMQAMEAEFQASISRCERSSTAPLDRTTNGSSLTTTSGRAPCRKAQTWAEKNTWFGSDMGMTAYAYDVHDELIAEGGVDCQSDAYYKEIEDRVKQKYPDLWKQFVSDEFSRGPSGESVFSGNSGRTSPLSTTPQNAGVHQEARHSLSPVPGPTHRGTARGAYRHRGKFTKRRGAYFEGGTTGERRGTPQTLSSRPTCGDLRLWAGCDSRLGRKPQVIDELRKVKQAALEERKKILLRIEEECKFAAWQF